MTGFNYKARIPTSAEYNYLMDATAEDNAIVFWYRMFSWVDDPNLVAEYPNFQAFRGCTFARSYDYSSADYRDMDIGFRPAFEPLDNDPLLANIADGDIITIGTLYMNNTPVKVPRNPMCYGDTEDYTPSATLEFRPALEDSGYQVKAIKVGDVFICDRCLLKNISYNDIYTSFPSN